jgi:uncharacterized protein YuzE
MAENRDRPPLIAVQYDGQADILTFTFTAVPQAAAAEEAADEVWVRYDPKTRRVITVDVLNFSARCLPMRCPQCQHKNSATAKFCEGGILARPAPG